MQKFSLFRNDERRTEYVYPPEYTPLSIVEQVNALRKVPAFAELDATWALNEGQDWYNSLNLPEWIENPLVYVWHEAFGGYHNLLDLVFEAIAKDREFNNPRSGQLTPERFRQSKKTRKAELKLKAGQPGDFLIVPSQAGDRWGGYSVEKVRKLYDIGEFGLGSVAEGCRLISHPGRLIRREQLQINCPGDEFHDLASGGSFDLAPFFYFGGGRVKFGTRWHVFDDAHCGSASAFVPQS